MILAFGAKLLGMFGLGPDLAKKFAWAPLLLIAGVVVWAGVKIVDNMFEDTIEVSKQAGAAEAVIAGQETALEQIGEANEAATEIRNDVGFARYCRCVRDAAPGYTSSCVRYLSNKPLPGDAKDPAEACPSGGG